ncbi:pantoate--beta-alanine ligase [Marinoscillum sp. MHG1-6]|uniref:pantoate--beta-alanine ligase n=1 Tax=Marinoscillum sp. MHG1-6 TaxID=2959627 RepID=UPI00215858F1|nr:pantoate--beta-alanine ligase [Marinoscillum sp. MHG1-6]
MQVVSSPRLIYRTIQKLRLQGKTIGFVATMGALHNGHLSLIRRSKVDNDFTVVSVFVNPLQFNNPDDYLKYPRVIEEDIAFLKRHAVDFLYAPSEEDMYPEEPKINLTFGSMTATMEGAFRPGHFEGVGLVVNKLLNQVSPDRSYFGLKDLQQFLIIRRMVTDLSIPVEIIGLPIVREESGLAMSSRNRRLSQTGLKIADHLFQGLKMVKRGIEQGREGQELKDEAMEYYSGIDGLKMEYLEIVNAHDLTSINGKLKDVSELAVCVAGYVEGIRLIDNLYLRQD